MASSPKTSAVIARRKTHSSFYCWTGDNGTVARRTAVRLFRVGRTLRRDAPDQRVGTRGGGRRGDRTVRRGHQRARKRRARRSSVPVRLFRPVFTNFYLFDVGPWAVVVTCHAVSCLTKYVSPRRRMIVRNQDWLKRPWDYILSGVKVKFSETIFFIRTRPRD